MLQQNIVVWDLETTGLDPVDNEIIQLAAVAINPRRKDFVRGDDGEPLYFESMMRALRPETIQEKALQTNGKTREQIAAAPHPDVVWPRFVDWIKQFDMNGKCTGYTAPISAGHNVAGFDHKFLDVYCRKYGNLRSDGDQAIFNQFIPPMDTLTLSHLFWAYSKQPTKMNLVAIREHFGWPTDGAHDAKFDCIDSGRVLVKLLNLMDSLHNGFDYNCKKCGAPGRFRIKTKYEKPKEETANS